MQVDKVVGSVEFENRALVVFDVGGAVDEAGPGDAVGVPDAVAVLLLELVIDEPAEEVFVKFADVVAAAPAPYEPKALVHVVRLDVVAVDDAVAVHRTGDLGVAFADAVAGDGGASQDMGVFEDAGIVADDAIAGDDGVVADAGVSLDDGV